VRSNIFPRAAFAALFVAVLAVLSFGLYLQLAKGMLPCPLCVIQRIAFIAVGVSAACAAVLAVRRRGQLLGATLVGLFSLAGLAVAARQVWLIRNPQLGECGISREERFLNSLPLAQWWPAMFRADGDCVAVTWTLFGFSVPELGLAAFTALILCALLIAARARRSAPGS
jgi:disulfide bond formation protein DsbB